MSDTNTSRSTKLTTTTNPGRFQPSKRPPLVLLLIVIAGAYLGWVGSHLHRVSHQRNVVARLESLGGTVEYEQRNGSVLMTYLVGDDAYDHVVGVELGGDEPFQDDNLALLMELPEIRNLGLRGRHITDKAMLYVAQLPGLELLGLDSTSLTADGLARLDAAEELTTLYLAGVTVTDDMLDRIGTLSNLRQLGFMESEFNATDFKHLASLPHLSGLAIFDSSIREGLRNLDTLQGLETLALNNVSFAGDGSLELRGGPHLKSLFLCETTISEKSVRGLTSLQDLEFLNLQGESITDDLLVHLAGLQELDELRLNNTKVSDDGLAHLTGLRNLQSLWLGSTEVSDAGLEQIASIRSLRFLFLDGSRVSADGLTMVRNSDDPAPEFRESRQTVIDELVRLFPG